MLLMFCIWEIGKVLILFCWEFGQLVFSYLGRLLCCAVFVLCCMVMYGVLLCCVVSYRVVLRANRQARDEGLQEHNVH